LDINHRCLEGGRVDPGGAEKKRSGGVDRKARLGYKNSCRSGGQETASRNKPLDNGGKIATLVSTKNLLFEN
jgi:hypothetical protein